jgi:cytochrome c oxidase assembly factor CtaG
MTSAAVQTIWNSWSLPLWPTFAMAATAGLYLRGWKEIRRSRPDLFPTWRAACFLAGLFTLWLAIGSPLAEFDDYLLVAHMAQHLVLMSVAPPLLLLGLPAVPLLRGIPRVFVREGIGRIFSSRSLRWLGQTFTHPVFAWVAMNVAYLGWHVPRAYELALHSAGWHEIEHACFFFTSLIFWFPVILPWPSESRMSRWAMLPYLLGADVVNTAISAFLTFCGRLLYPTYGETPRISSLSPLSDQSAAGAFMWVVGSIVFLLPAAIITARLLSPPPQVLSINRGNELRVASSIAARDAL